MKGFKKLIFTPFFILLTFSCTVEDNGIFENQEATLLNKLSKEGIDISNIKIISVSDENFFSEVILTF